MPIYMKYGDIKGSATQDGHKEWINLESCQLGTHRTGIKQAMSGGGGDTTGQVMFSDIVMSRSVDKSSPLLFKHACMGLHAKEVTIDFTETNEKGEALYLQVKLADAIVSTQAISGHGGSGDSHPMESLSLNFAKIWVSDAPKKSGSGLDAAVKYGWDVKVGKEWTA